MISSRISWASRGSWSAGRACTSAGPLMVGSSCRGEGEGAEDSADVFICWEMRGRSGDGILLEGRAGGGAVAGLGRLFALEHGLLEALFAEFEQFGAVGEFFQELGQGHVAGFHRVHDGFEAMHGVFEGGRVGRFFVHEGEDGWAGTRVFQSIFARRGRVVFGPRPGGQTRCGWLLRSDVFVILASVGGSKLAAQLFWSALNRAESRRHATTPPPAVAAVMDGETYGKSVSYSLEKNKLEMLELVYDALILLIVLVGGVLPWMFGQIGAWAPE